MISKQHTFLFGVNKCTDVYGGAAATVYLNNQDPLCTSSHLEVLHTEHLLEIRVRGDMYGAASG